MIIDRSSKKHPRETINLLLFIRVGVYLQCLDTPHDRSQGVSHHSCIVPACQCYVEGKLQHQPYRADGQLRCSLLLPLEYRQKLAFQEIQLQMLFLTKWLIF